MNTIIAFAHTKGGVGKSTLAWHIANALQHRSQKVKILDLDFQQTLRVVADIREQYTMPPMEVLQVENADELIAIFENNEDILIVDIGGFDSDLNRITLAYADTIIVPISNAITEMIGFQTFKEILKEVDREDVHILLNNIHPLAKDFSAIRELVEATNATLYSPVVRRRKTYEDAMQVGASVYETNNSKAIAEIEEVLDAIFYTS